MSKNILPDIAKLLGVEINEEFNIIVTETGKAADNVACILDNKIAARRKTELLDVWYTLNADDLNKIFNGEYTVVRKPFNPKKDEQYWSYAFFSQENDWCVVWKSWSDSLADYMRLQLGICFRTEEEALKHRPRIYKELTGKKWEGR